jgi:hypothetical protein
MAGSASSYMLARRLMLDVCHWQIVARHQGFAVTSALGSFSEDLVVPNASLLMEV